MDEPLRKHAQDLSNVLNLAKNTGSIEVPIRLHSIFVTQFNQLNIEINGRFLTLEDVVKKPLDEETREALSKEMANMVTPSLRYSNTDCMAYDFYRLLGFINQVKST